MKKIDKIIKYFKENMVVGSGGFTGSSDPKGPVAGYDPVMMFRRKNSGKVDYRSVKKQYKNWVKNLENK